MWAFSNMKNRVKQFRNDKTLTQDALAGLLSVSRQTIISIESSRYVPSTVLSLKIAKFLGKSVEELFELDTSDFQ